MIWRGDGEVSEGVDSRKDVGRKGDTEFVLVDMGRL
jgi:hypothetical protein